MTIESASEYLKPLPVIQSFSKPFWDAAKTGKLLVQNCNDCKKPIFFPRDRCPHCWSQNLGWNEASGKGIVYAFSITYEGVEKAFVEDLPIVLAWIDLPEGVRMQTNIIDCDPEAVSIGMDVEVTFVDLTDDISMPYFKPASA